MRLNPNMLERPDPAPDLTPDLTGTTDPRHAIGSAPGDLATRHVLPQVTQRRSISDGMGLAAGIGVIALLGLGTLWSMNAARIAHQQAPARNAPAAAPVAGPVMPVAAIAPPAYRMQGAPGVVPPSGAAMLAASNFRSAPTLVFDSGGADAGQSALADPATAGAHSNGNDDFAARLGAAGGTSATARASFDPRTTIAQGTLIPAVLETGLDTDVPGYVRAIISEDVRSFDGSRVLVPRSSRLIGQYRSGMQAGQKRAYVIWTRIIRSDGVSVNIGSPGVDFSGQSGLAGKVDTHFFERFGSGILLSVIGGLSTLGGTTTVIIGGAGQSAAAEAVGQSAQISPTVRVHQGEPIRVFTARDLDFSKVPGS